MDQTASAPRLAPAPTARDDSQAASRQLWASLALLWLAGTALRLSTLAVPPVIPLISADLRLSATDIGILSGLPVVLLAIASLPGSLVIARLGARTALVAGLTIVALGTGLRGVQGGLGVLYGATAIMGLGVAIMQPAMPVLARQWLPARIGFATAVYSNGLLIGELLPVWLAAPVVMPLVGESWRLELAVWAAPIVVIALLVLGFAPRSMAMRTKLSGPAVSPVAPSAWWPNWRDPLIWRLGLLFGTINGLYFATNAFLPAYLASLGRSDLIHGALTALNAGQLPVSLLLLLVAKRLELRAWPHILAGMVLIVSIAGLVFMVGTWTIAWAALLGFWVAGALILGLTFPPLMSEQRDVARTSAGMFTLSYAIGMLVNLASGAAWDVTGKPAFAFVPVALCALVLSISAWRLKAKGQLR